MIAVVCVPVAFVLFGGGAGRLGFIPSENIFPSNTPRRQDRRSPI